MHRWSLLVALGAGCDRGASDADQPANGANAVTVDVPRAVEPVAGVTPMAERVAVLGLLNKRNGIVRDITLKPGQAIRVGDVIVRLRACETTAPWENEQLTGAFVQLDVAAARRAAGSGSSRAGCTRKRRRSTSSSTRSTTSGPRAAR